MKTEVDGGGREWGRAGAMSGVVLREQREPTVWGLTKTGHIFMAARDR